MTDHEHAILSDGSDEATLLERTRALAEANRRLEELDRFKTDLVNMVSHDLRTPLTAIKGFTELLTDGVYGTLGERQREFIWHIQFATRKIERLVDDLLDFARIQAGGLELKVGRCDLAALLTAEASLLAPLAVAKHIALTIAGATEPCIAIADPRRLGQVIANLLGNAIKFTPAGGRIIVGLERRADDVRVAFADSGPGVPPELTEHVFERFYRGPVDEDGEPGTGLGLAIARAIIEAHGGRIGVDSPAGAGATFWFTLPGERACIS